jgi:hypothetical protein
MLSERRDPIFNHETAAVPHSRYDATIEYQHASPSSPRFSRFVSTVQLLATMLGIPLGLASGYSIYHANFSPETTCGTLRTDIISMLNQNADATTLRRLVSREVASFEHSCGSVDPDAVAAFNKLLAKPAVATASEQHVSALVKQAARRPAAKEDLVHHPTHEVARVTATRSANRVADRADAATTRARREADANWLAAVRQALAEHRPATRAFAAEAPPMGTAPVEARPVDQPLGRSLLAPAQVHDAPLLPPATTVPGVPTPTRESDPDHPVPPALIPNVGPAAKSH